MAKQNTSRQNYGNPFTAGSSVVQGEALAAPKFVDYSQFFDTSQSEGLEAASKALYGAIAVANEQHAKNMENMLPKDFDATKLAPGSVDGTYDMLKELKDKAHDLSRTVTNKRGSKESVQAQTELNKIKNTMNKHYGHNVEYNSIMIDHGKNKDFYSSAYKYTPGGGENYEKFIKFADPSAKITYDGDVMMITAEDSKLEPITFEEFKKLEPPMQQRKLILGIDELATSVADNAMAGKEVTDAKIDFTIAGLLNTAYQEEKDKLNVLTSLAVDATKDIGGKSFNFYKHIKTNPVLAERYLDPEGNFKKIEDPYDKEEYTKNFESDFKDYLSNNMQDVREQAKIKAAENADKNYSARIASANNTLQNIHEKVNTVFKTWMDQPVTKITLEGPLHEIYMIKKRENDYDAMADIVGQNVASELNSISKTSDHKYLGRGEALEAFKKSQRDIKTGAIEEAFDIDDYLALTEAERAEEGISEQDLINLDKISTKEFNGKYPRKTTGKGQTPELFRYRENKKGNVASLPYRIDITESTQNTITKEAMHSMNIHNYDPNYLNNLKPGI